MGFNSTATTLTLTAKLTPIGREKLISNNNTLITSFSLGDSDANYNAALALTTGQVPTDSGDIGPNNSTSNSTFSNINLRSVLILSENGVLKKSVERESSNISKEKIPNGQVIVSGGNLSQTIVNRNDFATDSLVNLFYSFGLSLTSVEDAIYTATTFSNGGFSDTALSGLATTKIVVLGLNNSTYGEVLDGKAVKVTLPTSAGTYTIYSTFQKKGSSLQTEDANLIETSSVTSKLGDNIAILFSDDIKPPNGSALLSWGTGFGSIKPFSLNRKQLYNLQTNSNISTTADTAVGVAYLDKGFMVITNPQIVLDYGPVASSGATTGTTITFDSVSTSVFQNITCIADRGEFGTSTNKTFTKSDVARISEVGLYDSVGDLIAVAKTDRQIVKNVNEFLALGIKIVL
jgi:hypothetical protein